MDVGRLRVSRVPADVCSSSLASLLPAQSGVGAAAVDLALPVIDSKIQPFMPKSFRNLQVGYLSSSKHKTPTYHGGYELYLITVDNRFSDQLLRAVWSAPIPPQAPDEETQEWRIAKPKDGPADVFWRGRRL